MKEDIRVLVVDDNPADVGLTKFALAKVARPQFDVQVADHLSEAIDLLRTGEFDVLLLDLGLPDSQGLETLKTVRAKNQRIPIVVLTGLDDVHVSLGSLDEGAQDYLTKDVISPSSLGRSIRYAIQRQQLLDALEETRKQAEQEKFKRLLESAPDAMVIINQDHKIVLVNYQTERLFGFDRDELLGKTFELLMLPDILRGDCVDSSDQQEQLGRRKDGTSFPAEIRLAIIDTEEGKLLSAAIRDITERKQAEQALRRANHEWHQSFDALPDYICVLDESGVIRRVNRTMRDRFEPIHGHLVGLDYRLIYCGSTHPDPQPPCAAVLENGKAVVVAESQLPSMEGWYSVSGYPLLAENGEQWGAILVVSDVTKRKEAEADLKQIDEQLHQSQKLEAVGSLAGGVAHEFNNLLQAIRGYTNYAIQGLTEDDQRFQDLQQVLNASERASTLTRQLLGFGRRQSIQPSDLDANEMIRDLLKLLRPLIGEHIELKTVLSEDLGAVYGDPSQLQQMLMNLCINARDAMPDGGNIVMKTEMVTLSDAYSEGYPDAKTGRYVLITVSDTGCGMSPEVRDHIFEPFFTTKEVGKGTGLGLAMVYGVVQQHQGLIHVYSEPGLGTQFKIYLHTTDHTSTVEMAKTPTPVSGGNETILIAEDEPLVRALAVRVLKQAGYCVLTATDGEEAIRVFEANADRVSLSVLDMVMPKLSGNMVFEGIKALRPDSKVVFCSGYDPITNCDRFVDENDVRLIQKPFDSDVLLRTVREVLDEQESCQIPQTTI